MVHVHKVLVQWKGKPTEDTSWEKWENGYHFEKKVFVESVASDTIVLDGPVHVTHVVKDGEQLVDGAGEVKDIGLRRSTQAKKDSIWKGLEYTTWSFKYFIAS